MGIPKTLKGWALLGFAGVWSLFVAVVVTGFLSAWAAQHHWFDNPDKTVSNVAGWLWSVASSPAWAWPLGLVLGATAGFAAGVWLDSLLRRKIVTASPAKQPLNFAPVVTPTPAATNHSWWLPFPALEKFCGTRYNEYLLALNAWSETAEKQSILQREINELNALGKGPGTQAYSNKRRELMQIEAAAPSIRAKYQTARNNVLYELHMKLKTGLLVARGVPTPFASGATAREITKGEWALLEFDLKDDSHQTAKADGISFKGLEFREP